jgi:MFS family permease
MARSPAHSSDGDVEKTGHSTAVHVEGYDLSHSVTSGDAVVTPKTWAVVVVLAASYGISFWPVPFFSTIQSQMAAEFGSAPVQGAWFTSVYSIAGTISFMICGANSDLFGRRTFILLGNVLVLLGSIIGATSHSVGQTITAHALLGFGGEYIMISSHFYILILQPKRW